MYSFDLRQRARRAANFGDDSVHAEVLPRLEFEQLSALTGSRCSFANKRHGISARTELVVDRALEMLGGSLSGLRIAVNRDISLLTEKVPRRGEQSLRLPGSVSEAVRHEDVSLADSRGDVGSRFRASGHLGPPGADTLGRCMTQFVLDTTRRSSRLRTERAVGYGSGSSGSAVARSSRACLERAAIVLA